MTEKTKAPSQSPVRVCSLNLRHSELDHGTPNEWNKRRPILKACLENMQPAIIGTQEGHPPQLNDILADLNEWSTSEAVVLERNTKHLI
jgi:hypothetical protein